jgi:hypothetical protein
LLPALNRQEENVLDCPLFLLLKDTQQCMRRGFSKEKRDEKGEGAIDRVIIGALERSIEKQKKHKKLHHL